jgi:hypothetical protein
MRHGLQDLRAIKKPVRDPKFVSDAACTHGNLLPQVCDGGRHVLARCSCKPRR